MNRNVIITVSATCGAAVLGFVGGMIFEKRNIRKHTVYSGAIVLDTSNEEPELYLRLDRDGESLIGQQNAVFEIVRK